MRRHEAQHGFDYDRETEARYPQALADRLGAPHDRYGEEVAIVRSARREPPTSIVDAPPKPVIAAR